MHTHINNINTKISRTSGTLCRLKRELPTSTLRLIYCALLQSRMLYAITPWYTNCRQRQRMITIQKKAIRHVSQAKYNSHTEPLFKKLNLLKIDDLHTLNCCKLYTSLKQGKFSTYIQPTNNQHWIPSENHPTGIKYTCTQLRFIACKSKKLTQNWNSME